MRRKSADVLTLALVVFFASLVFVWQWDRPDSRSGTSDAYWYMRSAAQFAGVAEPSASAQASAIHCANVQRAFERGGQTVGCTSYTVAGVSTRYVAIFTSRPGYPIASAPLVRAAGLARGTALTTGLFFLLIAAFGYAALRVSGLRRIGAAVGATAICLLPSGFWASRLMAEGPALAEVVAVVLSVAMVLRRPTWGRGSLLMGALAAQFVTKPATGAASCVTLLVIVAALATREMRRSGPYVRAWLTVLGVTAGAAATWAAVSAAMDLPGLTETVQDMATRHFRSPDISAPLPYLARRAAALWWHLPQLDWLPLLMALPSCVIIVWRLRAFAAPWISVAGIGVVLVTVHPLASEYSRLVTLVWVAVAAAIGILVDLLVGRVRFRTHERAPRISRAGEARSTPQGGAPESELAEDCGPGTLR